MTPAERQADTAWFGAVLGIGAAAMLMISLFFADAYLRVSAELWPPPGIPRLPRVLPTVNLAVLAAASAVLHLGSRRKGGTASVEQSRSGDRSHRSSDTASVEQSRSGDRSHRSSDTASVEPLRSGDRSHRSSDTASVEQLRSGDRSHRSSDSVALVLGVLFLALDALLWRTLLANGFTPSGTGAYGALFFATSFAHAALVLPGLLGLGSLLLRPRSSARRGWILYWDFLTVAFALFLLGAIWL